MRQKGLRCRAQVAESSASEAWTCPFSQTKGTDGVTSNSMGKSALKVGHCLVIPMVTRFSKKSESRSVVSDSLQPYGLYSPWNSPGQNTRVDSHSLLQGIFPAQGSNPGLPHCRQILYQLSRKGSLRSLEWLPYPFSSRSSRPRSRTGISSTAGRLFSN